MNRSLLLSTIPVFLALLCMATSALAEDSRSRVTIDEIKLTSPARETTLETLIHVTNVTGSTVTAPHCTVFRKNPSGQGLQVEADDTGTFEFPPASTKVVRIHEADGNIDTEHAVIEWSSDDTGLEKALTASMLVNGTHRNQKFTSKVLLNEGKPF